MLQAGAYRACRSGSGWTRGWAARSRLQWKLDLTVETGHMAWEWAAIGTFVLELLDSEAAAAAADVARKEAIEHAKSAWTRIEWARAEEDYRQRLLPFISTTRLLGNPKPVSIDQLYTDLYVYGRLSALRRTEVLADPRQDAQSRIDRSLDREDAAGVVGTGENLYLLGHPGAGKTTFLRYIGIRACRGLSAQVPVFLQLRDIVRSYEPLKPGSSWEEIQKRHKALIWESILSEFETCGLPDRDRFASALFAKGRAVVLIDGLDEVPAKDGLRAAVIDSICDLQKKYPKVQICVTCRIAASEYAFEHFRYAEVAPFTIEQQESFISKWYVDDKVKRSRLLHAWRLARTGPLRDLGRTPLLLALICLAYDDLGELPDRHVDLYREALDALLKRWDSSRSIQRDPFYAGVTAHRREQLLEEIAAVLLDKEKITFAGGDVQEVVQKWFARLPELQGTTDAVRADELLDQIEAQHGLVIQRARGIYSFAHLTIQEFLCARSICEGHPGRTLQQLAERRLHNPQWREVIVFSAGLLQDGTQFLEMLVRSSAKLPSDAGDLGSMLTHVGAMHADGRDAESFGDDAVRAALSRSAAAPLRLAAELIQRLDDLTWAGPRHGLRRKAALVGEHLSRVDAGVTSVFKDLSQDGSPLAKYLQVALVIVDSAAVATCAHRANVVAPLLGSIRS